jgi:Dolichyl-phosphate-mannose-protein mannosyltransferase
MSKSLPYFAVLVLAIAIVTPAFRDTTNHMPFYYDESDYMYAGTRGLVANYLDRPSLSLVEFIRNGIVLSRDGSKRGDISRVARDSGDITFYRHYHGPMYAYWIALCQKAGVSDEAAFRSSGLIIHCAIVMLIFWMFRYAFPTLPAFSALLAALAYLLNRTALVAASVITQHVLFPLFTALTLFFLALFNRTLKRGYWYAATACLGLGFATVESSFVLVGAVLVMLATLYDRMKWKQIAILALRGAAVFLVAAMVVWPKGVLALGSGKGYLYLAYMAVFRKTLAPISPLALWRHKFTAYPYEFVLPALAVLACVIFYRRLSSRAECTPFLLYAGLFTVATLIITLNYTYYHTSLLLATTVIIGVMAGELWNRSKVAGTLAASAALASLVAMTVIYHRETVEANVGLYEYRGSAIDYVKTAASQKTYYVPFTLVPPLHYYAPRAKTIGYDPAASTPDMLAQALSAPGEPKELLCAASTCSQVRGKLPAGRIREVKVADADREIGEPFHALVIEPGPAQ